MTEQNVRYLVQKFFRNQCTSREREELMTWIHQSADDAALKRMLEEAWKEFEPTHSIPSNSADTILSSILHSVAMEPFEFEAPVKYIWWKRLSVAAILILLIGTGGYFLFFNEGSQDVVMVTKTKVPVHNIGDPGRKAAMLTLSNGSAIALDSMMEGPLAQQGNSQVINKKGELIYLGGEKNSSTLLYNTLSTQKGELYPLNLSDGSRVWLNSSSTIRYPVAFNGAERVVEVDGEAYFEVAKDPSKPFRVITKGMKIEVLGTHFNLNSYSDEPTIKTTLVEGSLKVTKGAASVLLVPGQQANLKNNGKINLVKNVNMEEVISWKDGHFFFLQANLKTVMRQLARWYDMDIVYKTKNTEKRFGGGFERSQNLLSIQGILKRSDVNIKIEGKKIIVLD